MLKLIGRPVEKKMNEIVEKVKLFIVWLLIGPGYVLFKLSKLLFPLETEECLEIFYDQ